MGALTLDRDDPDWGWEFVLEEFVLERLREDEDAAGQLPEPEREAALVRVRALRRILAAHAIYIGSDKKNWCRCYTCEPVHGVPCLTLRALATTWVTHPDLPYEPENLVSRNDDELVAAGTYRRLHAPDPTGT